MYIITCCLLLLLFEEINENKYKNETKEVLYLFFAAYLCTGYSFFSHTIFQMIYKFLNFMIELIKVLFFSKALEYVLILLSSR